MTLTPLLNFLWNSRTMSKYLKYLFYVVVLHALQINISTFNLLTSFCYIVVFSTLPVSANDFFFYEGLKSSLFLTPFP